MKKRRKPPVVEVKEEKKETAEARILDDINVSHAKIKSFNSRLFYVSVAILNILALVIAMIYLDNRDDIEKFDIVLENLTWNTILILVGIFVCIMLLKTLPNFMKLYARTKSRKFGLMYRSIVCGEFYSIMTTYSSGENVMMSKYLENHKIDSKHSIDVAYSKTIFNRIATFIYSTVLVILGLIFWNDEVSVWILIPAIIALLINFSIVMLVWAFINHKKATLHFISNICKFLFNKRIIKDYEKFYDKIVDKLLIYNKAFKHNRILIFTEIMSYILIQFLKGVLLYFSLVTLNIGGVEILGDILYRFVLVDLILSIWPLQKGTIIFEIIFISLYYYIFFSGYLYWGLMIVRFFDYFVYMIQYLFVIIYDAIAKQLVKNSKV